MSLSVPRPQHRLHEKGLLDRIGATGSMLCAVHCALLPLVLALAPAIGAGWASENFEIGFIAFASALGLISLATGYRRHLDPRALALVAPGIGLLWCAVLIGPLHRSGAAHAVAMATGGSLIAIAHVLNLRLSRRHAHARTCSP
jgi:hypothetical protein